MDKANVDNTKKNKPLISIETQKRMHEFFLKTSAPRIVDEERKAMNDVNQSKSVEQPIH